GSDECGESNNGATPAGDSGKRTGALHRLANKAQIVRRTVFERNENGTRRTSRFRGSHGLREYARAEGCQVLYSTESNAAVNRSWVSSRTGRRGEQSDSCR